MKSKESKLEEVLANVFTLAERKLPPLHTRLCELPGWDSMNSVNLEMAIETEYHLSPDYVGLNDQMTLGELLSIIEKGVQS